MRFQVTPLRHRVDSDIFLLSLRIAYGDLFDVMGSGGFQLADIHAPTTIGAACILSQMAPPTKPWDQTPSSNAPY